MARIYLHGNTVLIFCLTILQLVPFRSHLALNFPSLVILNIYLRNLFVYFLVFSSRSNWSNEPYSIWLYISSIDFHFLLAPPARPSLSSRSFDSILFQYISQSIRAPPSHTTGASLYKSYKYPDFCSPKPNAPGWSSHLWSSPTYQVFLSSISTSPLFLSAPHSPKYIPCHRSSQSFLTLPTRFRLIPLPS